MNKDELLKMMDDVGFFREMNKAEREKMLSFDDHWMDVPAEGKILKEGEVDAGLLVRMKGTVSITKTFPTEVHLAQLVPGAIFGEVTLRSSRVRNSNVMADVDCSVLRIDNQLVGHLELELLLKVKDQIVELLISRLDEVNNRLGSFLR